MVRAPIDKLFHIFQISFIQGSEKRKLFQLMYDVFVLHMDHPYRFSYVAAIYFKFYLFLTIGKRKNPP